MKNFKIIIPVFLFTILIMSGRLEASCQIVNPPNGASYYTPQGQTTITITFTSSCVYDPSTTPYVYWYIDGVLVNPPPPGGIYRSFSTTQSVGVGAHTVRAVLYQFSGIIGVSAGEDTHTFSVLNGDGSCTSSVSRYLSGTQSNSQTSAYIPPGFNVAWNLSYDIFNEYWNNSIPCTTTATAQIGSPLNKILTATDSGNYVEMQNSNSGTYTYTAGGYLTLYTSVSIGSNASGGSAWASISW
jgi:hypothetical protein